MESKPHCLITMGMAGSGKTTFVRKLYSILKVKGFNVYTINLDPAIRKLSFPANLDICDTINFKKLMQEYSLGPNGAIITALNLFATKFHEVIDLILTKTDIHYILIDTPGQIEAFSWSASGTIITDSLASAFPTSMLYVVDTPRCTNPNSFMSNMLYASSIFYKTKLPIMIVFNKTDVEAWEFAHEWMTDFESFMQSLDEISSESYLASMNRSLALVLDEFYNELPAVGLSSFTGFGFDIFVPLLETSRREYMNSYLPELEAKRKAVEEKRINSNLGRMEEDGEDMAPINELLDQLKVNDNK